MNYIFSDVFSFLLPNSWPTYSSTTTTYDPLSPQFSGSEVALRYCYVDEIEEATVVTFSELVKKIFSPFLNKSFPKYEVFVNKKQKKAVVRFFLAGYPKENIECEQTKNNAIIINISEHKEKLGEEYEYLVGNAKKASARIVFKLPENFETEKVSYADGVLEFVFSQRIPVEEQPKKLLIS